MASGAAGASTGGASGSSGGTAGGAGASGTGGGSAAGGLGGGGGAGGPAGAAGSAGSSSGAAGGSGNGSGSAGGAPACVQQSTEAKLVKRPVDVIVYLDTSDSMKPAITATEANLETSFTGLLAASGIDYRAIMLVGKKVPASPTDAARFSYLYALGGSGALHENIVNWYDAPPNDGDKPQAGWGTYLRKEAFKVILVISDTTSGPSMSAAAFETALLAKGPDQLGTTASRNYRYHAIMGVAQNSPSFAPWLPADPIVQDACTGYAGGVSPNENAQEAAIQTGGLRFPLCETGSFDVVFKTIAEGEVEKAPVQCAFDIPQAPPPTIIDQSTIEIRATQGTKVDTYSRVDDESKCKEGRFTIANGKVTLCPAACASVRAQEGVKVDVLYGCKLPPKD